MSSSFYNLVAERAGISLEEAEQVTRHVLSSLTRTVGSETMNEIRQELPPDLFPATTANNPPDDLIDFQTFIGPLMNELDGEYLYDNNLGGMDLVSVYLDQEAVERSQAVFHALKQSLSPESQERIRSSLPADVVQWWDESI